MSEMSEAPVVSETPAEPLPVGTLTEHANAFGGSKAERPESDEDEGPVHPSAAQRREAGKFAEGKVRRSKDLVERVNTLTGRAKTAEEKAAALEGRATTAERQLADAQAELQRLRQSNAAPATIAKAEARVEAKSDAVADDPEPQESEVDEKYGGDYGKYLKAQARWETRQELRAERQREAAAREAQQREHIEQETVKAWAGRVETTKAKYADFEAVAFGPTKIPAGSDVDAFVMEDDNGPDVLYHLNKHPQELDDLLRLSSPIVRLKKLALLSERLSSSATAQAAGTTGSVPSRPVVKLPPKPPNPVRTEAQRSADGPAPTDGSLSIVGHRKAFPGRQF